jgi:dienelactone hydrolase
MHAHHQPRHYFLAIGGLLAAASILQAADPEVQFLKTAEGIPFAVLGEKPAAPAPTLFVLGGDARSSLLGEDVNQIGRLLMPHGYLCVSVDVPCHGFDTREGEKPAGLEGWKNRIVNGEDLAGDFAARTSKVLDHLIAEKYTDPARVAVAGTSRGGFAALHFAAADQRVQQAIGFAPVTHLPALAEFAGAEEHPQVLAQSVIHVAGKLVGKPLLLIIGNDDARVSTADCLALGLEVVQQSKGKRNPIPVEVRLVGTSAHRLHAKPMPQYGQLCAPHAEAAAWLLEQAPKQD